MAGKKRKIKLKSKVTRITFKVAILVGTDLSGQRCGGTLVGDKYVITAAECTDGKAPSDLSVRVGDTSLDEEFEATSFTIGVANIKQHPGYNQDYDYQGYNYDDWTYYYDVTNENNIAVLELSNPVSLSDYPNIKPACLPAAGAQFSGGATVTGWGHVGFGSTFPEAEPNNWRPNSAFLNEVDVTVLADGDCKNLNLGDDYYTYDLELTIGADLMCAGSNDSSTGNN